MSKQQTNQTKRKHDRESKCDSLIVITHNVKNSKSSYDSTYKTDTDTRLMEAGMPER